MHVRRRLLTVTSLSLCSVVGLLIGTAAGAAETAGVSAAANVSNPIEVLSPAEWRRVDSAVDRGLAYLATQQQADGSITAPRTGQPGITSLAVMAFLSRGHLPGEGQYGAQLSRAIAFVLSCQRDDGLLSDAEPESGHIHNGASHAGNYNHAISGLMLTEVYGMVSGEDQEQIARTIRRALEFTRIQQMKPKKHAGEHGGWRYLRSRQNRDADISVSSWQLMFYRSARNAEFEVPKEYIDEALGYIRRGFDPHQGTFTYDLPSGATLATRGVAGGAIVSLALGGEHQSEAAQRSADWILLHPFDQYNRGPGPYHYGAYYCSQGMFQLGGDYWREFFPPLAEALAANQSADGSWDPEDENNGDYFGRSYTTSLAVLALTPAYQLLPIFQR